MAVVDFPFCIYCGQEIRLIHIESGEIVYDCLRCKKSIGVEDEGLL